VSCILWTKKCFWRRVIHCWEKGLLAVGKMLLTKNDLADRLLQPPISVLQHSTAMRSDWYSSILNIFQQTFFSRSTVHRIVCQHLKFQKSSSCWVPKQLKPDQQATSCLNSLQCYNTEGQEMLERVVTGDDSWIYHYQPETKRAFMQWKHNDSLMPTF